MRLFIVVALVILIIWFLFYLRDSGGKNTGNAESYREDPEITLRRKCGGNTDLMERLIEYEIKLRPKSTRMQAIKNAIIHFESDNQ